MITFALDGIKKKQEAMTAGIANIQESAELYNAEDVVNDVYQRETVNDTVGDYLEAAELLSAMNPVTEDEYMSEGSGNQIKRIRKMSSKQKDSKDWHDRVGELHDVNGKYGKDLKKHMDTLSDQRIHRDDIGRNIKGGPLKSEKEIVGEYHQRAKREQESQAKANTKRAKILDKTADKLDYSDVTQKVAKTTKDISSMKDKLNQSTNGISRHVNQARLTSLEKKKENMISDAKKKKELARSKADELEKRIQDPYETPKHSHRRWDNFSPYVDK